jgi:hypothetical protein
MRLRAAVVSLSLMAALSDCVCADRERNEAHSAYIQSEVDAYAHAGTLEQVAADARQFLLDGGFELPPCDGRPRATTSWSDTDDGTRRRWHVDASARQGGTAVRFTYEDQQREPPTWTRDSRRRDLELEHEVLARIDPKRAAKVKLEAVDKEVHELDGTTVWIHVRAALAQRGEYVRRLDPPVDVTVSSDWAEHLGDDPSRVRHDVQLVSMGTGRHRIELHRVIERGVNSPNWVTLSELREWRKELAFIRRRDPTTADSIEIEARRRGQEAYDKAVDRGAIACNPSR